MLNINQGYEDPKTLKLDKKMFKKQLPNASTAFFNDCI